MTQFIHIIIIATTLLQMTSAGKPSGRTPPAGFETEIFHQISKINPTKNVIISPVSIQTCIAMGYFGAKGKTAEEIRTGLHLNTNNRNEIASKFEKLINSAKGLVKIANKLYANKLYEIEPKFNQVAASSFNSVAEILDFSQSTEAIKTINDWVEKNTNNKIQNLLSFGSVDGNTKMILVNAIYFKGEWVKPFSTHSTHQNDFWTSDTNKVSVKMMYNSDTYKYSDFSDLDAKAIEMPYKNSNLSMMIILPKQRNGLAHLLSKIKNQNFLELSNKLEIEDVDVLLPKFKIEFDITLNDVLKTMGMNTMFTNDADFTNLFKSNVPAKVSEVVHKAFIDVNEAGSEAAAATFMKIVPMSLNMDQKKFNADHPFIYLIKDMTSVYFVGQVVKF